MPTKPPPRARAESSPETPDAAFSPDDYRMSLMDHLRELRRRVIVCLQALAVGCVIGLAGASKIFAILCAPMNAALAETEHGTLAVTTATEGVFVQLKVAVFVALFIASPVIFWQIWKFVAPGLYDTEKRHVFPLVVASTSLFSLGAAFAYFVVFHFGFPVFLKMNGEGVTAVLSIDSYLTFATTLLVAFGASFQLPVVIWFMSRIGLVNHRDLIRGFRYSIVIIFVIAAILTPPDVLSQMMMAVPLCALYAIGIVVSYFSSTKPLTPPTT